jgi:hypothetical protein
MPTATIEGSFRGVHASRLITFLLLGVQLGLLLLVAKVFLIEQTYGFAKLIPVIFVGFVAHACLSRQWRAPFFLLLFPVSAITLLGLIPALALVTLSAGLFLICHLPIPIWSRAVTLIALAIGLGVVRADLIDTPFPELQMYFQTQTLPVLGAIFMFRSIVYLYDLRHESKPVSLWQRLGYFFLFPNVCFPLFPVIDYQAFKRAYFDRASVEIYQKGIDWILRGITHLLLYRIVYHYFVPDPLDVDRFVEVGQYALSSFLLYLRVSGLFHLIVGILCLFGYNLPETHHRYYLSESFTDFWRRINIYWKDFMMKLFYYPVFLRLRGWGMTRAMIAATLITFAITWALHSYQWFWIRGTFPLHTHDMLFWAILAVLVTVNSLYEERHGRKRKSLKGTVRLSLRDALSRSVRTVAVFIIICLLWSLWTSSSVTQWLEVMSVLSTGTILEWFAFLALCLGAIGVGVGLQMLGSRAHASRAAATLSIPGRAARVGAAAVALLAVANPTVNSGLDARARDVVATITGDQLSTRDQEQVVKGYYEDLLGVESSGAMAWSVRLEQPEHWDWNNAPQSEYAFQTGDVRGTAFLPSIKATNKGQEFTTNQWGFRGPEVPKPKPAGTYRIAFLGSSYTLGAGVLAESTFPAIVVQRLREHYSGIDYRDFDYLNLAYGGDSILRRIRRLEKALDFDMDLVVDVSITDERFLAVRNLRDFLKKPTPDVDPDLIDIARRAGATAQMSDEEIEHRLRPFGDEICRWGYGEFARIAREHGIHAVVLVLPRTPDTDAVYQKEWQVLSQMSRSSGLTFVELSNVYGPLNQRNALKLAPWDWHPNAKGHALIGERIYTELLDLNHLPLGAARTAGNP